MCGRYSLFDEQDNKEIGKILAEINRKYLCTYRSGPFDIRICLSERYSGMENASMVSCRKAPLSPNCRPISINCCNSLVSIFFPNILRPNISPLINVPPYPQPSCAGSVFKNSSQHRPCDTSGNPPCRRKEIRLPGRSFADRHAKNSSIIPGTFST